jgi:cytochrome c6
MPFHMSTFRLLLALFCATVFWAQACESAEEKIARRAAEAAQKSSPASAPDGLAVFRQNCVTCHGTDGTLGLNGAKDLTQSVLPLEERVNIITNGKKLMTPFGAILSPEEIQAVAAYTEALRKQPTQ